MTSRARAVVLAAFVLTTAWSWGVGASDDGVLRVAVLPAGLQPGQSPSSSRTAAPPAPTFRHTFGAERRQPEQARAIAADTTGLGADIVLLHGVGDVAGVRQLLPAASWNLVLSRQLAVRVEGRATATTAVAIRLSEVFRAVRQEHFLPPRDDETPASTAVLLRRGDAQVWLVALGSVPKPTDPIVGWLRERTREGAAVVIGGPATGEAIANLLGEGGAAPGRSIDGRPAPTRNGTKPTSMVTTSSTVSATAPRAACGLDIAITATGQSLAASKSAFLVPTQGSGDAPPRCGLTLDLLPGARAP
jgi:hypothetical protein